MSRKALCIWLVVAIAILLSACGDDAEQPTPTPAGGLQTKGLSPSEVALPWSQAGSQAPLKVVTSRSFRRGMGEAVHLIGEVENTGDKNLEGITIKAIGYGAGGKAVDTRTDKVFFPIVPPGTKAPFQIFFDTRGADRYELTVEGTATDAQPIAGLPVSNVKITPPSAGYTHVSGEVKNPGTEAIKTVRLVAVLRDDAGEVVEVDQIDLEKPVEAGSSVPFNLTVLHHGASSAEVRADAVSAQ